MYLEDFLGCWLSAENEIGDTGTEWGRIDAEWKGGLDRMQGLAPEQSITLFAAVGCFRGPISLDC